MNDAARTIAETEIYGPTAIMNRQPEELARPLGRLTKDWVNELGEQVELLRAAKISLLRVTNDNDWMDIGGNPYLTDSGIQNVAGAAGIEFGTPKVERVEGKDEAGPFVQFTCELSGDWRPAGRRHADIGTSSSRDPFFASSGGKAIPLSAINIGNVQKKSITNAQHRIVAKLLGIDGLSWEQLEAVGVKRARNSVRFKGSEAKVATGAGGWTPEKSRLWGILLTITGGSAEDAAEILFKETDSPEKGFQGKRDPRQLSDKAAAYWLKQFEQRYQSQYAEAFKGEGAPAPEMGKAAT